MLSSSRVARTLALTAAPLAVLALAGPAAAATKNGITPLAPKAGTSVPAGKAATFRMKVADPGAGVFVHVCKNNRRNKEGMICKKATILQAKKRKGAYEAKQQFFDFERRGCRELLELQQEALVKCSGQRVRGRKCRWLCRRRGCSWLRDWGSGYIRCWRRFHHRGRGDCCLCWVCSSRRAIE